MLLVPCVFLRLYLHYCMSTTEMPLHRSPALLLLPNARVYTHVELCVSLYPHIEPLLHSNAC